MHLIKAFNLAKKKPLIFDYRFCLQKFHFKMIYFVVSTELQVLSQLNTPFLTKGLLTNLFVILRFLI